MMEAAAAAVASLQRGRAFWGAEITFEGGGSLDGFAASTGPRLLGRGDAPMSAGVDRNCQASTGPRLLGRGDQAMWWTRHCKGPCFNGAAPFGARRFPGTVGRLRQRSALQRGRAFWGAEMR